MEVDEKKAKEAEYGQRQHKRRKIELGEKPKDGQKPKEG